MLFNFLSFCPCVVSRLVGLLPRPIVGDEVAEPLPAVLLICGDDGFEALLIEAELLVNECPLLLSLDLKYLSGSLGLWAGLLVGIRDRDGLFNGLPPLVLPLSPELALEES